MRTYFKNEKELNAAVNYLSKCKEFNDIDGANVLLMKLAGKTSIKGWARNQFVEVLVGQLRRNVPETPDAKNNRDNKKEEL
jgi:hypothetical protein